MLAQVSHTTLHLYADHYAKTPRHRESLKSIIDSPTLLLLPPLIINIPPPLMRLPRRLPILLFPRLRTKNIVYILNILVPPDHIMHTLIPQRLQRIVGVRQRDPATVEQIAQQRLVGEVVVARGFVGELLEDQVVGCERGVYNLEAAVGHTEAGG